MILLATTSTVYSQNTPAQGHNDPNRVYMGLGFELDYGGAGAKVE